MRPLPASLSLRRAGDGEWSPCDEHCTHNGPVRYWNDDLPGHVYAPEDPATHGAVAWQHRQAQWRILTVHHLTGEKADCRWWNLAALCQRCHLTIQGRVVMERALIL